MPFVDPDPDDVDLRSPLGLPAPESPMAPSPAQTLGAGFRHDNTITSAFGALWRESHKPDPDHNPLDIIQGTPYEQQHLDAFLGSQSESETRDIMAQIDAEDRDRQTLEAAGAPGFIAQALAGILDPMLLLPVGTVVKAARGGYSVGRSMANVGAAGAGQVAVQEGILQATQETRPWQESAINIGGATMLSAIIGGTAARMLSKAEHKAMVASVEDWRARIGPEARTGVDGTPARAPFASSEPETQAAGTGAPAQSRVGDASAGAALADTRQLDLRNFTGWMGRTIDAAAERAEGIPKVGGAVAGALRLPEKMFSRVSPTMQVFSSPFTSARRAYADLAETALEFEQNLAGVPTARGVPVDRHATLIKTRMIIGLHDELDRLWKQHYFGSEVARLGKIRADVAKMAGRVPVDRLSYHDFKAEVVKAARAGDQHAIPEVAKAAQAYRRLIDEPLKGKATSLKLFSPDMKGPRGDESHVLRAYNSNAIRQNPAEFVRRVKDWYKGEQASKAQAQQRIGALWDKLKTLSRQQRRLAGRIGTQQRRQAEAETRLSERGMEARRATGRVRALDERAGMIATEISDIQTFLDDMKGQLRSPELVERVKELEAELKMLQRAEKRSQVSEKDLAKIEAEERKAILSGDNRRIANILIGKAKLPEPPSLLHYIASNGGIKDTGGDVASIMGVPGRRDLRGLRSRKGTIPGLIRKEAGRDADDWGEWMFEQAPEAFGGERPTVAQVLDVLDEAARGHQPEWFLENFMNPSDRLVREQAAAWDAAFDVAGVEVRTLDDVAALWRGDDPAVLDDLDRAAADMQAAGAEIPVAFERQGVEEQVTVKRDAIAGIRKAIGEARKRSGQLVRRGRDTGIRSGEAEIAARANRGRLGILSDRARRAAVKQDILDEAQRLAREHEQGLRTELEGEIMRWEGKSGVEGQRAIRGRDEGEAGQGAAGEGERSISADQAIRNTVERIVASHRDLSDQELEHLATQTMNRILATPDRRLPYDVETPEPPRPDGDDTGARRGSLASRQFAIPSDQIEDFLVNDVEELAWRTVNTLVPDMLLLERFGHFELEPQFKALQEEVANLAKEAKSPAEARAIMKQGRRVETVMRGVLERIRGTFGYSDKEITRSMGRAARVAKDFNFVVDLGSGAISQIPDLGGTVFRAGFMSTFRDGWGPLFNRLLRFGSDAKSGHAELRRQARSAGIGVETTLHTRAHSLYDLGEVFGEGSRFEKTVNAAAQRFGTVNLMGPMTDQMKVITFSVASNEILRASRAVTEGTATAKQIKNLAAGNIDAAMAARIWNEFSSEGGGEVMDGTMVPNAGSWADETAALHFEAATGREVDIAVVTPGQEKPLWMSDPLWSLLGQFKSFIASANERILLANLQRRDAQALSGLFTQVALGMMAYRLYTFAGGFEASERPQDWIKEGFNRSGVLGWMEEGNAMAAKLTRGSVDAYRLVGADKPLTRYVSRSIAGAFLGPTLNKIERFGQVTGSMGAGDWSASDTHAVRRLWIGQNLFYIRRLLDQVEEEGNALFRVPESAN